MDSGILREQLFPDIRPYAAGTLSVDSRHTLYWEQCGNPGGTPIVFIHGGPGAGAAPTHRRFFDPSHYRIIIFDQRGCGRSKPFADIVDNTTDHLVADLDALRRHLSIDKWILFGGSWGATLALAYGAKWPERCAGFILRGVFLGTKREMEWFLFGMGKFFPEARRQFRERLPEEERDDLLANYHRRLVHPNEKVHGPAAAAWVRYESTCSSLVPKWSHSYSGNDRSMTAVVASGISAISDSLMAFHPAMDDPSNMIPSSKESSSMNSDVIVRCCHFPLGSVKRRSTNLTSCSFRTRRTSSGVLQSKDINPFPSY